MLTPSFTEMKNGLLGILFVKQRLPI